MDFLNFSLFSALHFHRPEIVVSIFLFHYPYIAVKCIHSPITYNPKYLYVNIYIYICIYVYIYIHNPQNCPGSGRQQFSARGFCGQSHGLPAFAAATGAQMDDGMP